MVTGLPVWPLTRACIGYTGQLSPSVTRHPTEPVIQQDEAETGLIVLAGQSAHHPFLPAASLKNGLGSTFLIDQMRASGGTYRTRLADRAPFFDKEQRLQTGGRSNRLGQKPRTSVRKR
jgi:hypothetical protein